MSAKAQNAAIMTPEIDQVMAWYVARLVMVAACFWQRGYRACGGSDRVAAALDRLLLLRSGGFACLSALLPRVFLGPRGPELAGGR